MRPGQPVGNGEKLIGLELRVGLLVLEDRLNVLDGPHPKIGRLDPAQRQRNMPADGETIAARLIDDREKGRSPHRAMHLDEVCAEVTELAHRGARFGLGHDLAMKRGGLLAVEGRAGQDDLGSDPVPGADLSPKRKEGVGKSPHITHAQHAVADVLLRGVTDWSERRQVGVHVPKPGNQKLPPGIDHPCAGGNGGRAADRHHVPPLHDDGALECRALAAGIDDGAVRDDQRLREEC